VRHGRPVEATGLAGVIGMAAGCWLGLAGIHLALSASTGITGVARAVLDEAVRMRASLGLALLVLVLVPTLPLALDHSERLHYRMQFLLSWSLGITGVILALLTIVLACGSICGDIDSGRIHMTLVKPLRRWEYLLGKWLGIALFDLLMVALAGAGTATFVRLLAATEATDAQDRAAVTDQVLTRSPLRSGSWSKTSPTPLRGTPGPPAVGSARSTTGSGTPSRPIRCRPSCSRDWVT
jgi:hypothetical protein